MHSLSEMFGSIESSNWLAPNNGITWFGSGYTRPGNKAVDEVHLFKTNMIGVYLNTIWNITI